MRFKGAFRFAFACLLAAGCGNAEPPPPEAPEQVAARVFDLAERLEKEHKGKEAFAAYRQIVRLYPTTPQGKKAAARINQAQKAALRRPR
jgi:TolA-binding protein